MHSASILTEAKFLQADALIAVGPREGVDHVDRPYREGSKGDLVVDGQSLLRLRESGQGEAWNELLDLLLCLCQALYQAPPQFGEWAEIGRASCRERV